MTSNLKPPIKLKSQKNDWDNPISYIIVGKVGLNMSMYALKL